MCRVFYKWMSLRDSLSGAGERNSPERLDPVELLVWGTDRGDEHILKSGISPDEVLFSLLERERELRWYKCGWGTWVVGNRWCPYRLNVDSGNRLFPRASSIWWGPVFNYRLGHLVRNNLVASP